MSRFFCLWIPHFEAWAYKHVGAGKHQLLSVGEAANEAQSLFAIVNHDRIIAASPASRDRGIQSGFTCSKARSLAPAVRLIPHHLPTTQMAWEEVLHNLYNFTPYLEPLRPGLLLADVHQPSLLVPLLRQWQAHAGLADDRTTAELAAYTAASGKLRNVRVGCSAAFLRRMPLTVFREMGVTPEVIQRLGWFGWKNVADLSELSARQLSCQFERGEILYCYAQAVDQRPVASFRPSPRLHTRLTFEEPVQEYHEIEPALGVLVRRLQERLNGRLAQNLTVVVEGRDGETKQHHILRDATASASTLCHVAGELLRQLLQPKQLGQLQPKHPVERLEVIVGGLIQPTPQQGTLFGTTHPSIVEAVRAVERRFPSSLGHFVVTDPAAYLPEHFARLQPLSAEEMGRAESKRAKGSQKRAGSKKPISSQGPQIQPAQTQAADRICNLVEHRTSTRNPQPSRGMRVATAPFSLQNPPQNHPSGTPRHSSRITSQDSSRNGVQGR